MRGTFFHRVGSRGMARRVSKRSSRREARIRVYKQLFSVVYLVGEPLPKKGLERALLGDLVFVW